MSDIRLDRFISERTQYTRSQIKILASKGKITVNGIISKKTDLKINLENDCINVLGNQIRTERFRYVLMNKPTGYVCSTEENDGVSVMNLVPPEMRTKNMFPAGRLDKDSLGALLITDDGGLAHRILSPEKHISKIYIVKLARPFQSKYINLFDGGIILSDGTHCLPARVKCAENIDNLAFIQIHEGKYHQVKRMFAAVGNHVEKLMRVSVGGLILPEKLGFGECMELLHKDVENLFLPLDFDTFCNDFFGIFSAFLINK